MLHPAEHVTPAICCGARSSLITDMADAHMFVTQLISCRACVRHDLRNIGQPSVSTCASTLRLRAGPCRRSRWLRTTTEPRLTQWIMRVVRAFSRIHTASTQQYTRSVASEAHGISRLAGWLNAHSKCRCGARHSTPCEYLARLEQLAAIVSH